MNETINIMGYIFKRKFFYIGWLVVKRGMTMLYADNNPYMTMKPEMEVEYVTFGLTSKSVTRRLTKKAKKLKGETIC